MSNWLWAKMPCRWQTDPVTHQAMSKAPIGTAIAALKLYLALCVKANYSPTETLPRAGSVRRSINQLCMLIDVSKPMVIAGLRLLQKLDIIERQPGRPAVYRITDYESAPYWVKLPSSYLNGTGNSNMNHIQRLQMLPNRGKHARELLQLYLYIAAIRDGGTQKARVSYTRIADVLGITRNAVSRAISSLVAFELLSVRSDDEQAGRYSSNIYWLLGPVQERRQVDSTTISA